MKFSSLHDLYLEQLKDLHSAETQLITALPKMAKAATKPELKSAFTAHLTQTKEQLVRLNKISTKLGKPFTGHTCAAMKGLIEEGNEWMEENAAPEVMDAGLIAAAQRVEHYEMAGYGSVHNFSQLLGEKEATGLLTETLQEEEATNKQLKALAKSIDVEAKV
jgi:ferritin-like metal-binding protein YciE